MSLTKRALFLLPPTNFPIQVTVHEISSDNGTSLGNVQLPSGLAKISFSKDSELRLKSFKSWLSHLNFDWSGQEILVPSQCVIFSVAENSHTSDQSKTQNVAYTFLNKKYKSQKINTISCGEYCVWSSEHKLVLGKVEFIGVPCEQDAGSTKLYAFVLSDTYLAADGCQREVKSDGTAVYKMGLDEIFSITDLQKLQNNTFNAQAIQNDSTNLLQLTIVSHTSPSSPLNINENHFGPELQPTSSPDISGSSFQMIDSDGKLNSLVRRIIANEKMLRTAKIYPKLDSVESEQSKEGPATIPKYLPDPRDEKEPLQCSTAQVDTNVREARKKKVTWLIGNCIALANGTQPQNVESIKKGYLLVARTDSKKLISGETRMTCTINNLDDTVYAGIRFEKRLILGYPDMKIKHLDDSKAGEYCEKCKGEKSLFIPNDIIGYTKRYLFHIIPDDYVVN